MGIVRPAIAEKPTAYWSERLREADIMHERLNTFREFLRQPQAEAIDLISWLELAGAPEPVPVPNIAGIAPLREGHAARHDARCSASTPPRFCASTGSRRLTLRRWSSARWCRKRRLGQAARRYPPARAVSE